MSDQDHSAAFEADRIVAEGKRLQAIRQAHEAFEIAKFKANADHAESYEAARIAFEVAKPVPLHPNHDSARANFEGVASTSPDLSKVQRELDAATWRAEQAYRAELADLRAKHAIVTVTGR